MSLFLLNGIKLLIISDLGGIFLFTSWYFEMVSFDSMVFWVGLLVGFVGGGGGGANKTTEFYTVLVQTTIECIRNR